MPKRKEIKKRARRVLRSHYVIYVAVCLIAAFLGAEFSSSLDTVKEYSEEAAGEAASFFSLGKGAADVLCDIAEDRLEDGKNRSEELKAEAIARAAEGNPALGRTRGVLAEVVNSLTSGSIFVTIATALLSISGSENTVVIIFILGSMLLAFFIWYFLTNMFTVVSRRIFLEGRTYEKISSQRFVYLLRVKKWARVSWTMFVTAVYQFLWTLTLVGGLIKRYSYYLVPYIAAENPSLKAGETIRLSRKMMKGRKWQCFVFELSYLGWEMLGMLTFGLTAVFYSNPYKVAAFSEYYSQLRSLAKAGGAEGAEKLNDTYLFVRAEERVLRSAYADVYKTNSEPEAEIALRGFRGFLANWFGIVFSNSGKEREYERQQARRIQAAVYEDAAEGRAYPGRLHPIPETEKRKRVETLQYIRHYSIWSLILLFFTFSFIGWLWEVSLHLITRGEFVNRGVLHGPWLPIYGAGGILILVVLNKLRKRPVAEFVSAVILCGAVEYFTAWFLEATHDGMKWWDYSGYFLNLHGRICAEGLLVFGFGGLAIVYVLAPLLDNLFRRLPFKVVIPVCVLLAGMFLTDMARSKKYPNTGEGITGSRIEEQAEPEVPEIKYRA